MGVEMMMTMAHEWSKCKARLPLSLGTVFSGGWQAALNAMQEDLFDGGYDDPSWEFDHDDHGRLVEIHVEATSPEGEKHAWDLLLQSYETQRMWAAAPFLISHARKALRFINGVDDRISGCPVTDAVVELLEASKPGRWVGSATELFRTLLNVGGGRGWPKGPVGLSKKLRASESLLFEAGIRVEYMRQAQKRLILITKTQSKDAFAGQSTTMEFVK